MIRLVLVLALLSGEAQALSCLRPDVVRSYRAADESPEPYALLRGSLAFTPFKAPPVGNADPGPLAPVVATFTGSALGARGWVPFRSAIAIQPTCAGPWCGGLSPAEDILFFARRTATGYVVEADACGQWTFVNPSESDIARVEDCMSGGPLCVAADF